MPLVEDLRQRLEERESYARSGRLQRATHRPIAAAWLALYRFRPQLPPRSATTRLFTGQTMQVVLPEWVSQQLYLHGFFEGPLTRALLDLVEPGMVFADVGAHFGYFSMLAGLLVGPTGRVFAFEPTPSTFEVLSRNTAGLGVRTEHAAAFSEAAELDIQDFGVRNSGFNTLMATPRGGNLATVRHAAVHAVALDDYFREVGVVPDFLKIDVESSELEVLHGMRHLLERRKPAISVEVGDYDVPEAPRSKEIVYHLREFGYECFDCTPGGLIRHQVRERYEYDNLIFLPG